MIKKIKDLLNLLIIYNTEANHIRVGNINDGGYIIPDDIVNIESIISLGIHEDVSFDDYFASKGIKCFQYDPSIHAPPFSNFEKKFFFRKQPFGYYNNESGLFLDDILNNDNLNNLDKKIILKFDVEGSEYSGFLNSTENAINSFKFITGEFHMLNLLEHPQLYELIYNTFFVLNKYYFISHIHVNSNCDIKYIEGIPFPSLLEITMLNRQIYNPLNVRLSGLSSLDSTNVIGKPQYPWNPAWFLI